MNSSSQVINSIDLTQVDVHGSNIPGSASTGRFNYMLAVMAALGANPTLTVECRHRGTCGVTSWHEVSYPSWNWDDFDYRITPQPKITPWAPADIPFGRPCWVRKTGELDRMLVTGVAESQNGVLLGGGTFVAFDALIDWEWTSDGGNWAPCRHES